MELTQGIFISGHRNANRNGNPYRIDTGATANMQDDADTAVAAIRVNLIWGGPDELVSTVANNLLYTTTTDVLGQYHFCGLVPDADGAAGCYWPGDEQYT